MIQKTGSTDLPPRMTVNKGKLRNTYYYFPSMPDEFGKRIKINLGHDREIALNKWLVLEGDAQINQPTINQIWHKYRIIELIKLAPATQKDYERCWRFLIKAFNDVIIDDIEPHHVQRYVTHRGNIRGNREKALLSTMFNFARRNGYTRLANPCAGVIRYPERGRDRYVSDDEHILITQCLDPYMQDYLDLLLITGARPSDIRNLLLSDIDHSNSILTIVVSKNQNRQKYKTITMLIEGELKTVLNRMAASRPKPRNNIESLFLNVNSKGQPLTYCMIRGRFDKARKATGINFQLRDLRAKNATDTPTLEEAKERLGHTTSKMTDDYRRSRKGSVVRPFSTKKSGK